MRDETTLKTCTLMHFNLERLPTLCMFQKKVNQDHFNITESLTVTSMGSKPVLLNCINEYFSLLELNNKWGNPGRFCTFGCLWVFASPATFTWMDFSFCDSWPCRYPLFTMNKGFALWKFWNLLEILPSHWEVWLLQSCHTIRAQRIRDPPKPDVLTPPLTEWGAFFGTFKITNNKIPHQNNII